MDDNHVNDNPFQKKGRKTIAVMIEETTAETALTVVPRVTAFSEDIIYTPGSIAESIYGAH